MDAHLHTHPIHFKLVIVLTGVSLGGASYCYRTGRQRWSQIFQRGRVGFQVRGAIGREWGHRKGIENPRLTLFPPHPLILSQGLTVLALVGGAMAGLHDKK